MTSMIQALADRDRRLDELVASGPAVNLRFRRNQKALSLRAAKLFHLLVKNAGARLTDDIKHTIRLAELWEGNHMRSADIVETVRELQTTLVEITVTRPGKSAGAPLLSTISGPMLDHVVRDHEDTGELVFRFSETMRQVMQDSDHWAVLSRRAVLAFESRYSLRVYEILALRQGLEHKASEVFTLEDLRLRLGVPDGRLDRWDMLKRKALEPAIAEVNQLSAFAVSYEPIKRSRSVVAVRISWGEKDAAGRRAAKKELEASRVGRRARREGKVEEITPAAAVPVWTPFPAAGTIAYSKWADLVRKYAPAPAPDVDRVAHAFRQRAEASGQSLDARNVEAFFVNFCRKWGS